MKKKKSTLLMVSAIIGVSYSLYLVAYFAGVLGKSSEAGAIGSAIATAVVTPHMVCVVVASIFNVLGWINNKRGFTLVSAILYCISGVLFIPYVLFVIPSIILTFIGYAKLKKINKINEAMHG